MSLATVKLSQILKLEYGKGLPEYDRDIDGTYAAYGANGVKSRTNKFLYDKPSIIVGRKGSAGELTLVKDKFWALDVTYYVTHDDKKTDLMYLYYALQTKNLTFYARGVKPGINRNDVYELEIPLPPLPIQQKIVARLDAIFAEIDKATAAAEANAKNAEALFQSYLTQVFEHGGEGWVVKNLSQISENLDSKRIPITKGIREEGDIPYYGASGIVDYVKDFIFDGDILLISEDGANLLARTYPISFSVTGKCWVNNHAHVVKFLNLLSQKFVEFYLNSISLKPFVSGMAQPKLNQAMLNKIPIPFPSLEQQTKLVSLFESIKESTNISKRSYIKKIEELSLFKQSILKQAFNGKLVKE